jgi:hypothetical protein
MQPDNSKCCGKLSARSMLNYLFVTLPSVVIAKTFNDCSVVSVLLHVVTESGRGQSFVWIHLLAHPLTKNTVLKLYM